jgi:hypothetical protein
MARPTCDKIVEAQLKFLLNFTDPIRIELYASTQCRQVADDTILGTIEVGQKQLSPLTHNYRRLALPLINLMNLTAPDLLL